MGQIIDLNLGKGLTVKRIKKVSVTVVEYENRIVGTEMIDPKDIIPNEKNWRRHPK